MIERAIGVFGGTFDPVHKGHIQMALEAKQHLGLEEVRLIPCHCPPHRDTPTVNSEQRLHLLSLAATGHRGLVVDDRELRRDGASYTVDTLASLRQELDEQHSLVFILGMDAFVHLKHWHQWERLRELAHLVVLERPNSPLVSDSELRSWLANADSPEAIYERQSGALVMLRQSLLPISATQIRQQLSCGDAASDLPESVARYINEQGLYKSPFK